jgi:hypothetical protein
MDTNKKYKNELVIMFQEKNCRINYFVALLKGMKYYEK